MYFFLFLNICYFTNKFERSQISDTTHKKSQEQECSRKNEKVGSQNTDRDDVQDGGLEKVFEVAFSPSK